MSEFNFLHKVLPTYTKGIWRMSMREVDSYLRKIDHFFRMDEIKIESKESRLDWAELIEADVDPEISRFLINMDRIAHETKYNLFLKSSASMIYSAFENSLCFVAQAVSDVAGIKNNVKRFKKRSGDKRFVGSIGNYALYLIEVHKVAWDDLDELWGRIDSFRFVRNCIVHDGGVLDVESIPFFDEISTHESGLSRDGGLILMDFFYLTQIVELMKEFFEALCLRLDGRVFIK
ncbi:hypothetical protein NQF78_03065 [Pseudomonas monsensis]|uniref:RiboL-PSP-HEPN domain-containing protein n=1 Tax=Pseudomonas monsensis TaxID=2745509 RepID=A0ABT3YP70_9PSED|nr:hypothetical protein [Pseudomonas monsensis]MCY0107275.1 hypothetical protein [Pseudomonas monsensis]